MKTASLSSNLFMDNGSSYSGLILPNLPPESQFLCLFKGHFTTTDPEARIRNIGNCARVRTLDRLFPFWEGEKKTSEICESNACSSWLRPQTESDWLKPPESHAKVSARLKTQTIRSMKTFTKRPAASSYASVKKRFRGKQPPKSPPTEGNAEQFIWTCNLCKYTIRGSTKRKVISLKSNHAVQAHKNDKDKVMGFRKKNLIGHSINTIATRTACLDLSQMWSWLASSKEKSKRTCGQNAP